MCIIGLIKCKGLLYMDISLSPYQQLVKAIILQHIKDTVVPFGDSNNRSCCRAAFNFLFNEQSYEYQGFCQWCEISGLNAQYWQKIGLMNLAYELNFNPWLRTRLVFYLKEKKHWQTIKRYYCLCFEHEYVDFIEAMQNA